MGKLEKRWTKKEQTTLYHPCVLDYFVEFGNEYLFFCFRKPNMYLGSLLDSKGLEAVIAQIRYFDYYDEASWSGTRQFAK